MGNIANSVFEKTKKIAKDVGMQALEIKDKATPIAEKTVNGIKDKADQIVDKVKEEKTKEKESEVKADAFLNTIIDGAYVNVSVNLTNSKVLVGEKEICRKNCEAYEICTDSVAVNEMKIKFEEYRKHAINPFHKSIKDNYIVISWRNGEKSTACVDQSIFMKIVKILS